MDEPLHRESARLLVLGRDPERHRWAEALKRAGYSVEEAEPDGAAEAMRRSAAELVLLQGATPEGKRALQGGGGLAGAGLIALAAGGALGALQDAGARDIVDPSDASDGERLAARVDQMLRRRRAADLQGRLRMEVLADLGGLGLSALPLEDLLPRALRRAADGFGADRCSAMLAEGTPETRLWLSARPEHPPCEHRPVDLAPYPEIRGALERPEPVQVDDALCDPLMAQVRSLLRPMDVRSLWVQPLTAEGAALGALIVVRTGRAEAFGPEDRAFAAACGSALASAVLTSRARAALVRGREELERACAECHRELVEANRRLKELIRLKDETLAVCSHDLRGPLNILLGHARLLAEAELDPEETASTQAILRQGKRLFELVESQIDRGCGELAASSLGPVRLDLCEICRERIAEHTPLAVERGVRIEENLPPRVELLADGAKLRQVLQVLLRNAIGRASQGGAVRVQVQRRELPDRAVARIAVADDGSAIPADELLTIFERYRRGPIEPGFALCREWVELQGGEIWAESGPGRGVAVFFTLPVAGGKPPG